MKTTASLGLIAMLMFSTERGKLRMLIKLFLFAMIFVGLPVIPAMSASVPIIPKGETFECTPTHIYDGDGPIWCEEGPRVRLNGINARELDEPSCKKNFPCTESSGIEARDALVKLVGEPTGEQSSHGHILLTGPKLTCTSKGQAGRNRTAALCVSPKSGDLSCAMVGGGWAAKWPKYWDNHSCSQNAGGAKP